MISIHQNTKNRKVFLSIKEATRHSRNGIRNALHEIGSENARHTKALIFSKDKNGRLYRFRGRLHRASAPGEAPANRTGALAASIDYVVRGYHQVEIGDGVPYGKFLELGTKNMAARSHLEKTASQKAGDNVLALKRYINREIKP